MSINPALTADEIAAMANGDDTVEVYLDYMPFTVIATAEITAIPNTNPTVQLEVGSWANRTNVRLDHLFRVRNGDTIKMYGRIRELPTTTILYMAEISLADFGLFAVGTGVGDIQIGDTVEVIDYYPIAPRAPRGLAANDYNVAVGNYHTYPEPICNINDAYGGHRLIILNAGESARTITLTVTPENWVTGTNTYSWTVPAGVTNTSGAATATFTGDYPPGKYWVRCTVTHPTAGQVEVVRAIIVRAHNDLPLGVRGRWSKDSTGAKGTFRLVRDEQVNIPVGAFCLIGGKYEWGADDDDIPTASKLFVGYAVNRPFGVMRGDYGGQIEIAGVMAILDSLHGYGHEFTLSSSVTSWETLPEGFCNLYFVLWWLLRHRVANVLRCHNFVIPTTGGTVAKLPAWQIPPAMVGDQLKSLAARYFSQIGAKENGEIVVTRIPALCNETERAALVTRATVDYTQYSDVQVQRRTRPDVASTVRFEGDYFDSSATTKRVGVRGWGPGPADSAGGTPQNSDGYVFDSAFDSADRAAAGWRRANREYERLTLRFDGRNLNVFEPCEGSLIDVVIDAGRSPTGAEITITGAITGVSVDMIGGKRVNTTVTVEPLSQAEQITGAFEFLPVLQPTTYTPRVGVPRPTRTPPRTLLRTPAAVSRPGQPTVTLSGKLPGFYATTGTVDRLYRFTNLRTPTNAGITLVYTTPSGWNIKDATFDLSGGLASISRKVYLLISNGTDSRVVTIADAFATSPTSSAGATVSGIYTRLESVKNGGLLIYSPDSSAVPFTDTFNFASSNGGWSVISDAGAAGTYSAGVGWVAADPVPSNPRAIMIGKSYSPDRRITNVSATFANVTIGTDPAPNLKNGFIQIRDSGSAVQTSSQNPLTNGATSRSATFDATGDQVVLVYQLSSGIPFNTGAATITQAVVTGFQTLGSGGVRYSTDGGATWGSALAVGSSPPGAQGGFDAQFIGGISLAASAAQLYRATSLGGSYSSAGSDGATTGYNPILAQLPRFKWGSVSDTNYGTNPDYLLGATGLISSHCLWKVFGAGGRTGITPSSVISIPTDHSSTTWKGRIISVLGNTSSSRKWSLSRDTGSSWTDLATLSDARSVRVQRLSATFADMICAAGSGGLKYYNGSTVADVTLPTSDTVILAEFLG